MTSSAGDSGLMESAEPPSLTTASRIAARSTTAGTPVKSCRMTRLGVKEISVLGVGLWVPVSQRDDVVTRYVTAIFVRSRFSSRILRE